MKKTSISKLSLRRESVVNLTVPVLGRVRGGWNVVHTQAGGGTNCTPTVFDSTCGCPTHGDLCQDGNVTQLCTVA